MLHRLLIILISISLILFGISSFFSHQADQQLLQGDAEAAITLYEKAQSFFPLRWDIPNKIQGAKLVQKSNLEFNEVSEIDVEIENAEIQNVPSLSEIPSNRVLKQGEILVPILMYHHIEVNPKPSNPVWASLFVTPQQLEAQFQYLASHNFHTISLEQFYQALRNNYILPANPVVLTFDDGYKSFYTGAFPLIKKYQFKATEFVITAVTSYQAYLSWDQIIELDKSGLVEIGAHSRTHPNLSAISKSLMISEIQGSRDDITAHLNKPVHWFAYPYGSYNDSVIKEVQNAGYLGAVSVIYGSVQSLDKIFILQRIMVDGRFSLDEFAKRL